MNRFRALFVFIAIAALATALAACGSSSSSSSDEKPEEVLKGATFEGVESADLDLTAKIDVSGDEGGSISVNANGPFQAGEKGKAPELDVAVEAGGSIAGKDINFEGGLVLLPNEAFIDYEGTDYEVDPTTYSFIESAMNQAQDENGGAEETTACQKAATGLEVSQFMDNLKNEGSEDVGGTDTTKVSGDLNVSKAIDQVETLAKNPACAAQLESTGETLPLSELEESRGELEDAIQSAHAVVYVGDDQIIRRITAELSLEPKGSTEKVDLDFDLALNEVNEGQEISAPTDAKPLEGLFAKLGVNPLELLEATQGGNGLGGLLEGLGGSSGGLGSALGGIEGSGGSAGSGGGGTGQAQAPDSEAPQKYLECVQGANTSADLQKCVKQLQ